MSNWTYVTGWIKVTPAGRTQEEKEFILKTVLNHLPTVRGSEEEMYVHTFPAGGYNETSSRDEYGYKTNNLKYRYYNCMSTKYHPMKLQSDYYIFIEGSFRDTYFEEQYRQLIKWITRLAKRIIVQDTHIEFYDSGPNSYTCIKDDFYDFYEWDDNWTDHLLWSTNPYHMDKGVNSYDES